MSEAPKTVWVTKYALTRGVVERPVHSSVAHGAAMNVTMDERGWGKRDFLAVDEWHPTREAALARAEEMRAAKIASLKRQIAKLEALEF